MATMVSRDNRTFIAGEDLTAAQFHFVTLEADGQVDLADAAGENCIGVLLNTPDAGQAATVCISGAVAVECGGTITAGDQIQTGADGRALEAASGDVVLGYAREDGVVNQVIQIELIQGGNVVPA